MDLGLEPDPTYGLDAELDPDDIMSSVQNEMRSMIARLERD